MATSTVLVPFHPVLADSLILFGQRNILIDDEGAPRLCDFGQSKLIGIAGFTATKFAGATRYLAPELLPTQCEQCQYLAPELLPTECEQCEKPVKLTTETDVYGFSMVALEVRVGLGICSFSTQFCYFICLSVMSSYTHLLPRLIRLCLENCHFLMCLMRQLSSLECREASDPNDHYTYPRHSRSRCGSFWLNAGIKTKKRDPQ